ncbi:ABC transporter permease [Vibrio parahaemolyticus]|nr:ABC transporter permease [Vibrio parahaemolyticus]KCV73676.1 ABC transporter permease [Vibrio parahaemolyticus VP49]EGQ8181342.1 ABC transporter permease [Vibrio parahaemolyticus]EJG1399176.1 ABC transporter permease [Vibrio parahaemolyticus]EKO4253311.1 ABC transporter permease [Vibrio parahaemolyticus]
MALGMSMNRHGLLMLLRTFLLLVVTVMGIVLIVSHSPTDPVNEFLGGNVFSVSSEQRDNIAHILGTNMSELDRLTDWLVQMTHGEWGYSNYYQQPVSDVLKERSGNSLNLLVFSWSLTLCFGYGLGLVAGLKNKSALGKCLYYCSWILSCLPSFWVGIILIAIFALKLHWFPVGGATSLSIVNSTWQDNLQHMILPIVCLVLVGIGPLILHTKEKVVSLLDSDYVKYAQMHQIPKKRLICQYLIKGSLVPTVTLHFAAFAELLGNAVLIESVFNYPGLGNAFVYSGLTKDSHLLLALSVCTTLMIATGNAFANIIQRISQPSSFRP